jgi:hypothetical protein
VGGREGGREGGVPPLFYEPTLKKEIQAFYLFPQRENALSSLPPSLPPSLSSDRMDVEPGKEKGKEGGKEKGREGLLPQCRIVDPLPSREERARR